MSDNADPLSLFNDAVDRVQAICVANMDTEADSPPPPDPVRAALRVALANAYILIDELRAEARKTNKVLTTQMLEDEKRRTCTGCGDPMPASPKRCPMCR